MNNTTLPYWLALMVAFAASYGAWKWYQVEHFQSQGGGLVVEDMPRLEEFELDERSGKPFRSADMHGKVWVVTFFFSTCPGSCPRLNASIRYLNSLAEIEEVKWVSISVDPIVDTIPVLVEYAKTLDADPERWYFCRGDLDYIRRVGRDILKMDDVTYKGHKDYATVIDRNGKVRGMFDATSRSQSQRMIQLLKECLAEPVTTEPLKSDSSNGNSLERSNEEPNATSSPHDGEPLPDAAPSNSDQTWRRDQRDVRILAA